MRSTVGGRKASARRHLKVSDSQLFSGTAVRELIRRECAVTLSLTAVGGYLKT